MTQVTLKDIAEEATVTLMGVSTTNRQKEGGGRRIFLPPLPVLV